LNALQNRAEVAQYAATNPDDFLTLNPDFVLHRGDYRVQLAGEDNGLQESADRLVASVYGSRGLKVAGFPPAPHSGHGNAAQETLVASRGQHVIGTLTVTVDAGTGLHAEAFYERQLSEMRLRGCRLCEVTRLAIHPDVQGHEVMATLFNVAFLVASEVYGRTDLVAEVHPRHAAFYRRAMGYRVAGPRHFCARVLAPAVLMHLQLAYARNQILKLAGTEGRGGHGLYRLFLPPAEQQGLLRKLALPTARVV